MFALSPSLRRLSLVRERREGKKKKKKQHSKCVLTVRNFETSMEFHLAFTVTMCVGNQLCR